MEDNEKANMITCKCCHKTHSDQIGEKVYAWKVWYYEVGDGQPNYVPSNYCPMCGRRLN